MTTARAFADDVRTHARHYAVIGERDLAGIIYDMAALLDRASEIEVLEQRPRLEGVLCDIAALTTVGGWQ